MVFGKNKKVVKILNALVNLTNFRAIRKERYIVLSDVGLIDLVNRWVSPQTDNNLQKFVLQNFWKSQGQLQQDLWALSHYMNKHNPEGTGGFFVEFGATNGVIRSNSYILEKEFNWKGILCEPARAYHSDLESNRSSIIDHRCVFSESGLEIEFHEVESLELSGIMDFKHIGGWEEERKKFKTYTIETVSLQDLLIQHDAPRTINYVSIDTEGSEYEILREFPFQDWNIETFSIEHNYSENERKIDELLILNGYQRVYEKVSGWDAWYIRVGNET